MSRVGVMAVCLMFACPGAPGVDGGSGGGSATGGGAAAGGGSAGGGTATGGGGGASIDAGPLELDGALHLDASRSQGFWGGSCTLDGGAAARSTFRVPLDGGSVHFELCPLSGGAARVGDRVPTAGELDALKAALAGLVRTRQTVCGADKPDLRLDVTTPTGLLILADSFYACVALPDRIYVDNIDAVWTQLELLAP